MKLSSIARALFAAGLVALPAAAALGQVAPPSIAGTWTLDAEVFVEGEDFPCVYQGTTTLTQDFDQVNGPATLSLVSGPTSCPAELSGTLNGTVSTGNFGETLVNGTIDGSSPAGGATFTGSFSPAMVANAGPGAFVAMAAAMQAMSGSGSLNVGSGPFAGASGTWTAAAPAAPTLAPFGLTILVALLLLVGYLVLRRQGLQHAA